MSSHSATHMGSGSLTPAGWMLPAARPLPAAAASALWKGIPKPRSASLRTQVPTNKQRMCFRRSVSYCVDLRVSFSLPVMHKSSLLGFFPIPESQARRDGTHGRSSVTYLHLHPPHAHDIILDNDRDGICPPWKRNTQRGGQWLLCHCSSLYTLGLGG